MARARAQFGMASSGVHASAELMAEFLWGKMHALKTNMRRFARGQLARADVELLNGALFARVVSAISTRGALIAQRVRRCRCRACARAVDDAALPCAQARVRETTASPSLRSLASGRGARGVDAVSESGRTQTPSQRRATGGSGGGGGGERAPDTRNVLRARVRRLLGLYAFDNMTSGWRIERSALARLVYLLQLDDYVVLFAPESGAKRVQRLGGSARELQLQATPLAPASALLVRVAMLNAPAAHIDVVVPAALSLRALLALVVRLTSGAEPTPSSSTPSTPLKRHSSGQLAKRVRNASGSLSTPSSPLGVAADVSADEIASVTRLVAQSDK